MHELSAILTAARERRRSRGVVRTNGGGGAAGQIIVHGTWVCPVQGPVSFTDTFGAPRSGGRRHQGNDLFSPSGTPLVAVTDGSVFFQGDPLGGNAAYVQGNDGNTYYYAHLNDYVGGARSVTAGELIGHVGNTGDAAGGPAAPALRDPARRSERPRDRSVPHAGRSLRVTTGRVSGPIGCEER